MSGFPESLRHRIDEQEQRPTLDKVRDFLAGFVSDAISPHEIRSSIRRIERTTTRGLKRDLTNLEESVADPQPPGILMRMVASDANWALDDLSDEAAAAFLRQLADVPREIIAEADARRAGGGDEYGHP